MMQAIPALAGRLRHCTAVLVDSNVLLDIATRMPNGVPGPNLRWWNVHG